jgi:hypothetical protein
VVPEIRIVLASLAVIVLVSCALWAAQMLRP